MPLKYGLFIQDGLEYRSRDDVDESRGYWAQRSDGHVEYVAGRSDAPHSRFDNDVIRPGGEPGLLGRFTNFINPFNDDLAGRQENGTALSPQGQAALRAWLKQRGIDGHLVTNENAGALAETVSRTEAGMLPGENFDEELWRVFSAGAGETPEAMAQFLGLYGAQGKAQTAVARVRGRINPAWDEGSESGMGAGFGDPGDFTAQGMDRGAGEAGPGIENSPANSPGSALAAQTQTFDPGPNYEGQNLGDALASGGFTGAARGTAAGVGGALGADSGGGLAPGNFAGGVQVDGKTLREFVESDWGLAFNAALNTMRDAGAAGIFMDWLSGQMNRFVGEYKGVTGQMALEGRVPDIDFTSFLAKKGLLPATLDQSGYAVSQQFADFQEDAATAARRAAQASSGAGGAGGAGATYADTSMGTPIGAGGAGPLPGNQPDPNPLLAQSGPPGQGQVGSQPVDPLLTLIG